MPQFDQSSFLNQIFWFFICFIAFYFLISYFFLPKLSNNIKFRKKKITVNSNNINNIFFEKSKKILTFNKLYNIFYINFENYLKNINNKNKYYFISLKKLLLNDKKINKNIIKIFSCFLIFSSKKLNNK